MKLSELKKIRKANNLTYKNMAEELNVSLQYYWMIENGERKLSYDMAIKIATIFDMTPDQIFLINNVTTS